MKEKMKEEYGIKFMKGKKSKEILEQSGKLREIVKNTVIKGDIYDPEACIDWDEGIKSYIPTNFIEYSGVKIKQPVLFYGMTGNISYDKEGKINQGIKGGKSR